MSWGTIIYLAAIFLGGLFHYYYPIRITTDPGTKVIGFTLIILATAIILWAVTSARKLIRDIVVSPSVDVFKTGSYRFSRNPTYLGLTLLIVGFGFVANSFPIIISAIIAFVVVHFTALKKEEQALLDKFGEVYKQYKAEVRRWL